MHPEQFLLDENGEAAYVAAAIPDKFSETGQVWGNPLYNWPLMQEDGFSWWKRRMQISTKLFDVIRMDHFIGFVKNLYGSERCHGCFRRTVDEGTGAQTD